MKIQSKRQLEKKHKVYSGTPEQITREVFGIEQNALYTDKIKLVKEQEDEEMKNCQNEVEQESKWTLLPFEIKDCCKGQFWGSSRHYKECNRTKVSRILKIIFILSIITFITLHARCFSKNWSNTPSEMKWEEFCEGKSEGTEACVNLKNKIPYEIQAKQVVNSNNK
jgi:hypothetical protein